MANYGDYFSDAFTKVYSIAEDARLKKAQYEFDKWKEDQNMKLRDAQTKYYDSVSGMINNPGGNITPGVISPDQVQGDSPTTFSPEDYMITQETRNVRGIPQTVNVQKLKPSLSEKHADVMTSNSNLLSQLELAKSYLKQGAFTGLANKIPGADLLRKQIGSPADIGLAQVLKQMQSGYITSQTGAQRGFKEMQWYEPAMPTIDMPKEKLVPMLENSAILQELNLRNMLITAKKRGDRLGEYADTYKQLTEKYPTSIVPYGIGQGNAGLLGKNVDKIKQALSEGYKMDEILKHLNGAKNGK